MEKTLLQIVRSRAAQRPDALAYTFLRNGSHEDGRLSYSELETRVLSFAAHLQDRLSPRVEGERALILLPAGLHVPTAILGASAAGLVPVPAPPPESSHLKRALPRLRAIIADCQASVVITSREIAAALKGLGDGLPDSVRPGHLQSTHLDDLRWVEVEGVPGSGAESFVDPGLSGSETVYLQYTSGSTSKPRGARITHDRLLANCHACRKAWGYDETSVAVNWMPYFHDYGLVEGLIQPLFSGAPAHLMSPLAFLKRPDRWLRAISDLRADHSSAPNFAYEHCLRFAKDKNLEGVDLSSWRVAGIGAEVIRPETLEQFAERFSAYGFDASAFFPSYGLAEATLLVSTKGMDCPAKIHDLDAGALRQGRVRLGENPGNRRRLVSCGQVIDDHRVIIVDSETGELTPEGRVGEVWVAGPSVAEGYWRADDKHRGLFDAQAPDGSGPYLRTGDLGSLVDGDLLITGRAKELIILAGANHYPEDLEWSVEDSHPAVRGRGSVAFAVDDGREEKLVMACELERGDWQIPEVFAAVRRTVAELHEVEVQTVLLLRRGTIPKTSSGKLQRSACRDAFLNQELEIIERWDRAAAEPTPSGQDSGSFESITSWLRHRLAELMGCDLEEIDVEEPFAAYGLASRQALGLVAELEQRLDTELSETLLFRYPTISAVADHLAGDAGPGTKGRKASPIKAKNRSVPMAIIGMACRLPGAPSVDEYWQMLSEGTDAIGEIPPDRWDVDAFFDPDPSTPGKMITRWGGFLKDVDHFDAKFFGISPREACHLDPRQRLMLEVGWEALEHAGQTTERLSGSSTGVFVATLTDDYGKLLFNQYRHAVDAYSGPGTAHSVVANRLSYFLDLRGPSLALDTACSGSLVALHLAAQSLERGECSMAVAGGVSVLIEPGANIFFSKAGAMAPDGRCKTFDKRANGIVRSEGIGLVVLKPLDQAIEDGDRILATMLGSAINHDGRSNGIMAPNGEAQEALLRTAYARAGVDTCDVQYIEAHGTGTSLGDPIETTALGAVLGENRDPKTPCAIGSVKTNLGHLEPAAGIAGVIKVVQAIGRRRLPKTLHFEEANPLIPFEQLKLRAQADHGPWPADDQPLIAGVSGFGIGGANGHVVLGEPPLVERASAEVPEGANLLSLSARSPEALTALARRYLALLDGNHTPEIHDLCHTAARHRSRHPHRMAVVGETTGQLADGLRARLRGPSEARRRRQEPRLVWCFSGQGTHWTGMGQRLRQRWPVFDHALRDVDAVFHELAGRSLLTAFDDDDLLAPSDTAQPAIFAMQVALTRLWRSWGIEPTAIVGQSLGEVAAAHAAGALGLHDAVKVVFHRSRLMATVEGHGETAVLGLSFDDAQDALGDLDVPSVGVAGSTSPATTVISGDPKGISKVVSAMEAKGVFCRRLAGVRLAFHSPQMDPLRPELEAALADIEAKDGDIPLISSVTGEPIDGDEMTAAYWGANLREPFRFAKAAQSLWDSGLRLFLEIGPHAVLEGALRQIFPRDAEPAGQVVCCLRRDKNGERLMMESAATLFEAGCPLDLEPLVPVGQVIDLPSYPWQRERFWISDVSGAAATQQTAVNGSASNHPLLGSRFDLAPPSCQSVWQMELGPKTLHYLDEHKVNGAVVLPGTTYLEMALAAGHAALGEQVGAGELRVSEARFEQAMFLDAERPRQCQLSLSPDGDGLAFVMASRSTGDDRSSSWQVHARGHVVRADSGPSDSEPSLESQPLAAGELDEIRERCAAQEDSDAHYGRMESKGFGYGPSFRVVHKLWRRDGEALGRLILPAHLQAETKKYGVHPVFLDAGLQMVAATLPEESSATFLPVGVEELRLAAELPSEVWCHCLRFQSPEGQHRAHVRFYDADGACVVALQGLRFQRLDNPQEQTGRRDWHWRDLWQEATPWAAEPSPLQAGSWLLLTDDVGSGVGEALGQELEARGQRVRCLAPPEAESPEDAAGLAQSLVATAMDQCLDHGPLRGVVHLWSLDLPAAEGLDGSELRRVTDLSGAAMLGVIRAVTKSDSGAKLWLATRGARVCEVSGEDAASLGYALTAAPLWGLAQTFALQEHFDRCGRLIDLDPAASAQANGSSLMTELLHESDSETVVGYRQETRRIPRLSRYARHSLEPAPWRVDGSYLITGGFGGLGLAVARRMVENGARRLILLSRSQLPPRRQWARLTDDDSAARKVAAVRELESMGASVHVAAVDVADRDGLAAFLDAFQDEAWPPIRGVVHSAGVVQDELMATMEPSRLSSVMAPKVAGAWNLHQLLLDQPLDFFTLFSSAAALLPPPGQGAYSAGNGFLDLLAHHRRALGLPAISLNWGPWGEVGMAARMNMVDSLALAGAHILDPVGALDAFEQSLQEDVPQMMLISADWPKLIDRFFPPGVEPPLIAHLRDVSSAPRRKTADSQRSQELLAAFQNADGDERRQLLLDYLMEIAAQVLRLDAARIEPEEPLNDLGIDSIMAVELKTWIEDSLGVSIPMVEWLKGPSLLETAERVDSQLATQEPNQPSEGQESNSAAKGAGAQASVPVS